MDGLLVSVFSCWCSIYFFFTNMEKIWFSLACINELCFCIGFYINGALAVIWFVAWHWLIYENPARHPRIEQEERLHIQANTTSDSKPVSIPWFGIFTSRAFYGILICQVCCNFTNYGLMSCLPLYLSNVLNFDISSNGFLSALPWLCCCISTQIFANITDWLRSRNLFSTTVLRKVNGFLGTAMPGLFLVLAGYAKCNSSLAVSSIVVAMFFFGANFSGYNCNNLDIAPAFAGVIFGLTNTVATIPGFVAPAVVNWVTEDNIHSEKLWRQTFFIFAAVGWFGGLAFILLASGEVQTWAVVSKENEDSSNQSLLQGEISDSENSADRDELIET